VGVAFSLAFQVTPLDVNVAANTMYATGIRCVRLYSYPSNYLQALWDAGIHDVMVTVPTHELHDLADTSSGTNAKALEVAQVLKPFYDNGMRFRVNVGNEPLPLGREG